MTYEAEDTRLVRFGIFLVLISGCSSSEASGGGDGGAAGGGAPSSGGTNADAGTNMGGDAGSAGTNAGGTGGTLGSGGDGGMGATAGSGSTLPPASCQTLTDALPTRSGATLVISPGPGTSVTLDGQEMSLRAAISTAQADDTVVLEPGTYTFDEAPSGAYTGVYITEPNVTVRGSTGDPDDVVLDSSYADHGDQTAPVTIAASGVVLAHLTVRRSIFHLVHLWDEGDDVILHDLHLEDGGEQFIKASPGSGTVDGVQVSCSTLLMTANGRDNVWGYGAADGSTTCYTGGIDTHDSTNWSVLYNHFEGIYCDASGVARPAHGKKSADRGDGTYTGGLAEHAIHMWNSAQGTGHRIDGNTILDCARGIGIGLVDEVYGGNVSNNVVWSQHAASREHDVGIIAERAHDLVIENNTVFYSDTDGYQNAIEYRWGSTDIVIRNNLTNRPITSRDGANATLAQNVTDAAASLFVDASTGDLHLESCDDPSIVGAGEVSATTAIDIDGDSRATENDIGADQCQR